MQMLTEIGAEQNTMTVVMMPSEFIEAARTLARGKPPAESRAARPRLKTLKDGRG